MNFTVTGITNNDPRKVEELISIGFLSLIPHCSMVLSETCSMLATRVSKMSFISKPAPHESEVAMDLRHLGQAAEIATERLVYVSVSSVSAMWWATVFRETAIFPRSPSVDTNLTSG